MEIPMVSLMDLQPEYLSLEVHECLVDGFRECKPRSKIERYSSPSDCSVLEIDEGALFECRICQEEEEISNLEAPCACSGTLKYAHRKCIQRWCNEKGDTNCEICHQTYKHGYIAPMLQHQQGSISIDLNGGGGDWGIVDAYPYIQFRNPRILALAAAERELLESNLSDEYYYYTTVNSTAICWQAMVLILMTLLLLLHGIIVAASTEDVDRSMLVWVSILRLLGFFLPFYIMGQAMRMLQQDE